MNSRIAAMGLVALAVASLHAEDAQARSSPSSHWGVQLSGAYSPSRANLDLEWDIIPGYEFAGHNFAYTGYTANSGSGVKYLLLDDLSVDLAARYRYFSELVSDHGQGLDTGETTLGIGYRF